ncbi:MAG: hypothetical protein ACOX6T_08580 [Myxococcales bacterium]
MRIPSRLLGACALPFAIAALSGDAFADRLEWLVPERLAPGRFEAGLTLIDDSGFARLPSAAKVASSVELREGPSQGPVRVFAGTAERGRLDLRASIDGAADAMRSVEVGAPAARVSVRARPPRPVKGRDVAAELEITVLRGDGQPDADAPRPVVRTNVGEIAELEPLGDGRFSARYLLPKTRFPEVAIVVAFAPWPHAASSDGARGVATIPLASSVSLPGTTEPRVSIEVEIAGEQFGPVDADAKGRFEIPVVVPPGHRMATSIATDRAGNRRQKRVDLQLPPTDRIACVANPTVLPADGASRARILCAATDPFGTAVKNARLTGAASAGRLDGPRSLPDGVFEWELVAPGEAAAGGLVELHFGFPAGGAQSKEHISIELVAPPVAAAELEVLPDPVFLGAKGTVRLIAKDARGRPVKSRPVLRAARGDVGPFSPAEEGALEAVYAPPAAAGDWTDLISGLVLPADAGVPTRLVAMERGGEIVVRAESSGAAPVAGLQVELRGEKATTGADGVANFPAPRSSQGLEHIVVRAVERPSLQASLWRLFASDGVHWFPRQVLSRALAVSAPVRLAPETPVDIRVELLARSQEPGPALRYAVLDKEGGALEGREVVWWVSTADGAPAPTGDPVRQQDGSVVVPLLGQSSGAFTASVVDVASGVSAALEAQLP